ncbi:hypothetical protein ASPCAL09521 [Aspergillus calidoustus]|uniref:DUF1868 domain-containing protein n=1 Tax=Aspergillus calidoustus TaxID=454130 RepID=A0A0U5GX42_ASPCI|nr:hypothetical protein ASPCAL09521 [Aspergillus calidoustus]
MADHSMPPGSIKKFWPNGVSKIYRGHSVICHLPEDSPLRETIQEIHEALAELDFAGTAFPGEALLPETSWHMTVFICVRDLERAPNVMPGDGYADDIKYESGLTGPYEDWLEYTRSVLEDLELDESSKPPYRLAVQRKIPEITHSVALALQPLPDSGSLVGLREELSKATGIRHLNHDSFKFHITLAYMTRVLSEEEKSIIRGVVEEILAEAPETVEFREVSLCSFQNMQAFNVEVTLADAEDDDEDEEEEEEDDDVDEDDEDEEEEEGDEESGVGHGASGSHR